MSRKFYSKVLLFGEYSVIKGSRGLALPYRMFEGSFSFNGGIKDQELESFCKHLSQLDHSEIGFDLTSFRFDIGQGIFFDSTIPQGFGIGSSGALCSALYDRYVEQPENNPNMLRKIFSLMESHFHGSSSGIDPLISYLDQSILIEGKDQLGLIDIPSYDEGNGAIFLLNTGRARRTEPLVNLFLEKCKNAEFDDFCISQLAPITNDCIRNFLSQNIDELAHCFKKLSTFQISHFTPMVPKLYQEVWTKGLESDDFFLKLCGAGGGGFLLGLTRDFSQTQQSLKDYEIRKLLSF